MESFLAERKWPWIPAGKVLIQYEEQFFPDRVVRPWKKFQQGAAGVSVLGIGKNRVDVALKDTVQG